MTKNYAPKLFIDSSVLIAAVLSDTGASNFIFRLAVKRIIKIVLTKRVLKEAKRNLLTKYGESSVKIMLKVLVNHKESIVNDASLETEKNYQGIIDDQDDLHILAGAEENKVNYLMTLDKKHFITSKLKKANLPFKIMLPGEFLTRLRAELENNF